MATRSHRAYGLIRMAALGVLLGVLAGLAVLVLTPLVKAQECAPASAFAGEVHADDALPLAKALVAATPALGQYVDPTKVEAIIIDRSAGLLYVVVDGHVCHGVIVTDADLEDLFRRARGLQV